MTYLMIAVFAILAVIAVFGVVKAVCFQNELLNGTGDDKPKESKSKEDDELTKIRAELEALKNQKKSSSSTPINVLILISLGILAFCGAVYWQDNLDDPGQGIIGQFNLKTDMPSRIQRQALEMAREMLADIRESGASEAEIDHIINEGGGKYTLVVSLPSGSSKKFAVRLYDGRISMKFKRGDW